MKDWNGQTIWYAVYGIFDKGRCIYVGATKNAFDREQNHKQRFGKQVEFKVFNWTRSEEKARNLERKYIRDYTAKDEAEFNINGSCKKPKRDLSPVGIPRDLHYELSIRAASNGELLGHYVERILRSHTKRVPLVIPEEPTK